MKKTLGVLGGMGPQATIDFQQKVLDFTSALKDQEHMRVVIDNHPQIPPRVAALLGQGESPVEAMQKSLDILYESGARIIAMPCVTAHYFLPQLKIQKDVEFLRMPEITSAACLLLFPGKVAGILSTEVSAKSEVFSSEIEKNGVKYIIPSSGDFKILDRLILGVKSKQDRKELVREFIPIIENMRVSGADYFVLACTEVPIIVSAYDFPHPFVDATTELAKASIEACGYGLTTAQ